MKIQKLFTVCHQYLFFCTLNFVVAFASNVESTAFYSFAKTFFIDIVRSIAHVTAQLRLIYITARFCT